MEFIKNYSSLSWKEAQLIMERDFTCGYCGNHTSSVRGLPLIKKQITKSATGNYASYSQENQSGVYICTHCQLPSFFWDDIQVPGHRFGSHVEGISSELSNLYEEARNSYSVGAYTGVVLLCRKLLMNIAVEFGETSGKNFVQYVNYLNDNHFISANSRSWVDKIRTSGNEANHETIIKTKDDAANLIKFCEMLMKTNFEYPSLLD
ncbi:DUF4145 domain-containing protein [Enterococcus faecalis]|uniref:DUF4145 domain-containing protein n=1 Tax=Enterococcus faecalis TaxID=1351 RepID=UPI00349E4DF1